MNRKSYTDEFKQQMIEVELEEDQYVFDVFNRFSKGEKVTERELSLVKRVENQRKLKGESIDTKDVLSSLEKDLLNKKTVVEEGRKETKKRKLNRDRLRRQRRLQDEKRKK